MSDRWQEISRLYNEALSRDADLRVPFLEEACAGDASLRLEVESLLAHEDASNTFFAAPAVQAVALEMAGIPSALLTGRQIGSYRIESPLGAGGMGEVYRATDAKLGREVAIKVLPASLAHDPERLRRLEREARLLAALNHPHIGAIYGLEEFDGGCALVLELVEGSTLADRLNRGPLPIHEALTIASQIAEALEAAHEKGIIHRDLKPANIHVTPDGVVKVLDFGLARALVGEGPAADVSPGTMDATGEGTILGTAAYMSPEQARGLAVDKRTDIWAFGCVLHEMLTGRTAFTGETVSDTMAAILEREPDWTTLPPDTPVAIRTLLTRCLAKDRRERIADISTARFLLAEHAHLGAANEGAAGRGPRPAWRRVATHVATALVASAVVGAGAWVVTRPAELPPPRVSRFTLAPSRGAELTVRGGQLDLAITPDGRRLVYVGNNGTQLFVRTLDALESVAVFTGSPAGPFVSPDGQWIGFVDNSTTLKKVAITGGPAVTVAPLDINVLHGATWAPDDTIIFATGAGAGLQRVAAAGGPTTVIFPADRSRKEGWYAWPEMLPGGRAVLFTIMAPSGGPDAAHVAVLDLQTGMRTILVRGGTHARYLPSGIGGPPRAARESGHLVYGAAGGLRAVPFDLASLTTRGTPVPVIPTVVMKNLGAVDAAVADVGTLAYVSGTMPSRPRTLAWVDRQGRETPIGAPSRAYVYPRLSPDSKRAAMWTNDEEFDLWIWDLVRTTFTRATFHPGVDNYQVWTPDGRRMIFSSGRADARNLFWQATDGTGTVERLTTSNNVQYTTAVSPDGRRVLFTETAQATGEDVMQLELEGNLRATPLVQSSFAERNGIISPDGRWLAYEANNSGLFEIYVRPFPDVESGHWQVSTGGGTRPLWARSGQELVYVSPTGALMRVEVARGPLWSATTPTLLVKEGYYTTPYTFLGRTYDISSDGQRFLMIKDVDSNLTAASPSLVVVQNWSEELRRTVPLK